MPTSLDEQINSIIETAIQIWEKQGRTDDQKWAVRNFQTGSFIEAKEKIKQLINQARVEELEAARIKLVKYNNKYFKGEGYISVPEAILDDAIKVLKEENHA